LTKLGIEICSIIHQTKFCFALVTLVMFSEGSY